MSIAAQQWAFAQQLKPAVKLLLVVLADKAGEEHSCFPGQRMLAELTCQSERTVRSQLSELAEAGLLVREQRRRADGYRTSDRFWLAVDGPISPANLAGESPAESADLTGKSEQPHRQAVAGQEPSVEPKEKPQVARASARKGQNPFFEYGLQGGPSMATGFEHFWAVYPRREGRRAAELAFERAVKRIQKTDQSAKLILDGAFRYRDDPNREPQFTAHGSTWLNQDRWGDDPLPPRGSSNNTRPTPPPVDRWEGEIRG